MSDTMSRQKFFQLVDQKYGLEDGTMIARAYNIFKDIYRVTYRDNGERHFDHARRVALRAIDYNMGASFVAAALGHDAIEDGWPVKNYIRLNTNVFTQTIVTTLSKQEPRYDKFGMVIDKRKISNNEYFEGIHIISSSYPDIARLKIFDRIDNLVDMNTWDVQRKQKYLKETIDYIFPLVEKYSEYPALRKLFYEIYADAQQSV